MQLYDMTIKEHEEFRRWSFLCRCACGFLYLICLFHNLLFHLLNLQATTTWLKCLCILHYMSIFTFIFFWTALNSWYCTVTLVFFDPTSIGWSCFNLHSLSMYKKDHWIYTVLCWGKTKYKFVYTLFPSSSIN